jgi:hypothetical protein
VLFPHSTVHVCSIVFDQLFVCVKTFFAGECVNHIPRGLIVKVQELHTGAVADQRKYS